MVCSLPVRCSIYGTSFVPSSRRQAWNCWHTGVQTLSEDELVRILPEQDGWIAGDDPANRRVLTAGAPGRLRALVKWGIGTDNIDFEAARELNLAVSNIARDVRP